MMKFKRPNGWALAVLGLALGLGAESEATLTFQVTDNTQNYLVWATAHHVISGEPEQETLTTATSFVDGKGTLVARAFMLTVGDLLQVDVGGRGIGQGRGLHGGDPFVVAALDYFWWVKRRGLAGIDLQRTSFRSSWAAAPSSNGWWQGDHEASLMGSLAVAQANSLNGASGGGGGTSGGGGSGNGSGSRGGGRGDGSGSALSVGGGIAGGQSQPEGGASDGGGSGRGEGDGQGNSNGGSGGAPGKESPGQNVGGGSGRGEGDGQGESGDPNGNGQGNSGGDGGIPGGEGPFGPGGNPPGDGGGGSGNGPEVTDPPIMTVPEPSSLASSGLGVAIGLGYGWLQLRRRKSVHA